MFLRDIAPHTSRIHLFTSYQFNRKTMCVPSSLSIDALRPLQAPAAYAVGILASFWMIQRVATFWTS